MWPGEESWQDNNQWFCRYFNFNKHPPLLLMKASTRLLWVKTTPLCQILGDFQTIQHYTDKHIVIFNQNASHTASLFKKTLPGEIFFCNKCIFWDGTRPTKLSTYKVLEVPPVIFVSAIDSKTDLTSLDNSNRRQGVFQHICIVCLQNKKGI